VGLGALFFVVIGAFFAFVIGGWAAGRIDGSRVAERSALHGAIVWLLAVPILISLSALGAGGLFGGWYGGLAGSPVWVSPSTGTAVVDASAAIASRNGALASMTALLIGLIGSVLGGWMASGQEMSMSRHRVMRYRDYDRGEVGIRRSA